MDFFIESVRKHPCLWYKNHSFYRDVVQKDIIWDRIAKECNMLGMLNYVIVFHNVSFLK